MKRNSNVVSALLKDFEIAEEVLATSGDAAGSALAENEKYLDSINGKLSIFKATFEELSNNFVDSEFVKVVVDIGTGLLNVLNIIGDLINALGGLKTVLVGLAGALVVLKLHSIPTLLTKIITPTTSLIGFLGKVKTAMATYKAMTVAVKNTNSAALITYGQSTSALGRLSAAFKAAGISASTAQIAVAAFMIALTVIVSVVQKVKQVQEELRQKQDEAASSAAELTTTLSDLVDQYITLSDKVTADKTATEELADIQEQLRKELGLTQSEIDELTSKYGSLTEAIKQATVAELQEAERDLRQGAINAENDMMDAIQGYDVFHYGYNPYMVYDTAQPNEFSMDEQVATYKAINELIKEGYDIVEAYSTNSKGDKYSSVFSYTLDYDFDSIKDAIAAYEELGKMLDIVGDSVGSNNLAYHTLYEYYDKLGAVVSPYIDAIGELNNNLAEQYMLQGLQGKEIPQTEAEFQTYRDSVVEDAIASGEFAGSDEQIADAIDSVLSQQSQFKNFFVDTTKKATGATEAVNTLQDSISGLEGVGSGLEQLDKIYADILNGGDFDYGSLISDEFTAAFSDCGDAYSDFMETVANSPKDINACQDAFNNLVTEYLRTSDVLTGVDEATRDVTIAYLEQMGVANAVTLVDEQLALQKERLRIESQLQADASLTDVLELYDEETATRITAQAIYELAIAKITTNENAILTSSDIDQLEALAKSAGATAESLLNVAKAKAYITKAEELETQKANLIASGADPRGISVVSTRAANYRLWAEDLLNQPIEYDVDFSKYKASYTGGSSTNSARSSAAKAAEEAETWFERQLKDHQHLVAMEQESEEEYLNWLDKAYKQAYKEGIIELDDYYKYQEEVYQGLQDLFKDYLNDIEHEISMRENYDSESKKIISLYKQMISSIEKEIATARKQGLSNEDDYIQELQSKWQDYNDAIKEIQDEATKNAKDALDELVEYRIDMIKQDLEDEKGALDKKLDYLKEFYDKQKEMLQDQYDEEEYLEEQAEKRKSVSDIQAELAMLEFDDSAWAQKRKLELQEELTEAQKDLTDFEDEHALELALDALDDAYDAQEKQIEAEMDALEEKLNDPEALYNQALTEIQNNTSGLYKEMLEYNRKYGTGNDDDVTDIYEEAYKALLEYKQLYGKDYNGVVLTNSTGYTSETGSWNSQTVSGESTANKTTVSSSSSNNSTSSSAPSLTKGSSVTIKSTATHFGSKSGSVKMSSQVPGGKYTVYNTSGSQVLIGRNGVYTGWVKKSDIEGYAVGTRNAKAGIAQIFENGYEQIFTSSDGNKYKLFNAGDKVLNAKATDFLYDFANSGGMILSKMFNGTLPNLINKNSEAMDIHMGDIIIQGAATHQTVSEIRRAQRENIDYILKEFTKLNK